MVANAWGWWFFWVFVVFVALLIIGSIGTGRRRGGFVRGLHEYGWGHGGLGLGGYPLSYGPWTGKGPKNYRRSDERIADEVNDRLTYHGEIDASEIEVLVRLGVVTLKGQVASRRERRIAEEIAESVSGVTQLQNDLVVAGQTRSERGHAA